MLGAMPRKFCAWWVHRAIPAEAAVTDPLRAVHHDKDRAAPEFRELP